MLCSACVFVFSLWVCIRWCKNNETCSSAIFFSLSLGLFYLACVVPCSYVNFMPLHAAMPLCFMLALLIRVDGLWWGFKKRTCGYMRQMNIRCDFRLVESQRKSLHHTHTRPHPHTPAHTHRHARAHTHLLYDLNTVFDFEFLLNNRKELKLISGCARDFPIEIVCELFFADFEFLSVDYYKIKHEYNCSNILF